MKSGMPTNLTLWIKYMYKLLERHKLQRDSGRNSDQNNAIISEDIELVIQQGKAQDQMASTMNSIKHKRMYTFFIYKIIYVFLKYQI